MGAVRGAGPRRPNTTAYFVALALILVLLVLLCCYFIYFCITKVKELTAEDSPLQQQPASAASPRATVSQYPVQPGIRESATAMAKMCRGLPAGGTVFPEDVTTAPVAPVAPTAPNTVPTTAPAEVVSTAELPEKIPVSLNSMPLTAAVTVP